MSEADDWKLPRPADMRSIVADEPSVPLSALECARLRAHPSLCDGYPLSDWFTVHELRRMCFMRFERARGRWREG